jgi:hypothetical protein
MLQGPTKCWHPTATLHSVTSHKNSTWKYVQNSFIYIICRLRTTIKSEKCLVGVMTKTDVKHKETGWGEF